MTPIKSDPLFALMHRLREALAADFRDRESRWADAVHKVLGELAAEIQEEVRAAEQSKDMVGGINPDFQSSPNTERHVETTRGQMIQLGERVHQLRADIRLACEHPTFEVIPVRLRGEEIATGIENVRQADDKFLLDTFNSNPGAGD